MGVTEDEIQNTRVNIRGNHVNFGDEVPRQFLQVIAGENQQPIDDKQERTAAIGALDDQPAAPADQPGDCKSGLAVAF